MVLRGIALKVSSLVAFVTMASLVKMGTKEVPSGEAAFFRSLFAIPVVVVWLAATGRLSSGLRVVSVQSHFWRGLIGSCAMLLGFSALALLPLPDATAIGYAAPLLVVIFSSMFLDEKVGIYRFTTVIVGLIGVLIVLAPRLSLLHGTPTAAEQLGALAALGGATIAALIQLYMRRLVQTESTSSIVFWFSVASTVITLMTFPFGWVMPSTAAVTALIGAGLFGGFAQVLLTSSYRFAPPSTLAPFEYLSMILALLSGYLFFGEVPTVTMLIGASFIVSAGLFIIFRERYLGLAADRHRKTSAM